jgi:RNA polymerase sigma-70 factor, ECF subfamily
VAEWRSSARSSDELLQQARAGSEEALRLLYENHRLRVLRLAYSLLGDADEAEDIAQDVMVYALTHLDRYDAARGAFATWLHAITVSRCRDRARRERTGLRRISDWWHGHQGPVEAGPDAEIDRLDAAGRVGRALSTLTPLQREALVLREVEELSFDELGRVLQVPLRTAQARVTSAHASMRRALGGRADTGGAEGTS